MSKGEMKIVDILNKEDIHFEREKTFPDLKWGLFRFDFYLPCVEGAPAIIEYDGEQHFSYIKAFYKTRQEWLTAKERDRRKNSFCLARDVRLYRIPYWELDNIHNVDDLLSDKYRVKTRWYNDELMPPQKK